MTPPDVSANHRHLDKQTLDDQSSWEYSCFRYYQLLERFRSYNNLIVNELTFITTESRLCRRTTSPFDSVVSSVMLELGRSGKKSEVERALEGASFFFYRDLKDQGAWLLSQGVPILELITLIGNGEGHHTWFFEKDMSILMLREHIDGVLASCADDRSHVSIKRLKQRIRVLLKGMSDHPDVELVKLLRSGRFEDSFGIMGTVVAIDMLAQGGLKGAFRKRAAKARSDYKSSMEELSVRVVQLFKSYEIEPCYTKALLIANGLLGRPYFLPDKNPESLKSKGQEKLRKLYNRSVRKSGRKKQQT